MRPRSRRRGRAIHSLAAVDDPHGDACDRASPRSLAGGDPIEGDGREDDAKPAENASSASSFCRPGEHLAPTSPVPSCEAITTMPNAIMITWLRPSRTVLRANGSCTLLSNCVPVEPNDRPTSVVTTGT